MEIEFVQPGEEIVKQLKRIADAQEGMLAIAAEARRERLELADQMKKQFKAGFVGGSHESGKTTGNQ